MSGVASRLSIRGKQEECGRVSFLESADVTRLRRGVHDPHHQSPCEQQLSRPQMTAARDGMSFWRGAGPTATGRAGRGRQCWWIGLASVLLLAACARAPGDPVLECLRGAAKAAEARDADGVLARISESYNDTAGGKADAALPGPRHASGSKRPWKKRRVSALGSSALGSGLISIVC